MNDQTGALDNKQKRLSAYLQGLASLGIGFSGGVDSTLLLAAAHQALGDRVIAMTAVSPTHPRKEVDNASKIARQMGVRHILFESHEMMDEQFIANGPDRCYFCKKRIFSGMRKLADELGVETLAHGANFDDRSDHRPGQKAADEFGIVAPLNQFGFTKGDIRQLAKVMGLSNWNRPAMACLATRVPYGVTIDAALLKKIEKAESIVLDAGISQCRVRHHQDLARIEIDLSETGRLLEAGTCRKIIAAIRALGYKFVCMDMEGFESGKMNR